MGFLQGPGGDAFGVTATARCNAGSPQREPAANYPVECVPPASSRSHAAILRPAAAATLGDPDMTKPNGEKPMSEEQRREIKRLCHAAEIPDKSGEFYTEQSARELIEDLRGKASVAGNSDEAGHKHDW